MSSDGDKVREVVEVGVSASPAFGIRMRSVPALNKPVLAVEPATLPISKEFVDPFAERAPTGTPPSRTITPLLIAPAGESSRSGAINADVEVIEAAGVGNGAAAPVTVRAPVETLVGAMLPKFSVYGFGTRRSAILILSGRRKKLGRQL